MNDISYEKLIGTISLNLPPAYGALWLKEISAVLSARKDLSNVWPRFAIFLLTDATQCASRHPQCEIVAQAYRDELMGNQIDWHEIQDIAAHSAWAASDVDKVYAEAALAAANDDVYGATDVAEDAGIYREISYAAQAEKLLELLRECK